MRGHERIEELIAIRAIGGLDADDIVELETEMHEHGPDCAECRRLENEYGEVAGRLAFALDPVAVRHTFQEQTIELALAERVALPPEPAREPEIAREPAPAPRRRGGVLRPLIGIAAAVALFAGGWLIGGAVMDDEQVPADATVVALEGEPGAGTITAAFQPGEEGIFLAGSGLPALPEDQVYELWLFTGETPASALCATPNEDGSMFEFIDASMEGIGLLAVTVESSSCPDAPTTTPIFVGEVATA
jgi:Anti-sigma-K factor rskA